MNKFVIIRSISTSLSAVIIPLVILFIGNEYTKAQTEREIEVRFVELAIGILRIEPTEHNRDIRKWAVSIVNKYSGIPLSEDLQILLIKKQRLELLLRNIRAMEELEENALTRLKPDV